MLSAPYISDNPFRLVGIGAATLQSELRSKANAADKAAKVGILPETGLVQVFGIEKVTDCANQVRTLANRPKERTVYRLFWPLIYQPLPGTENDINALGRLQSDLHEIPLFYSLQLRFVQSWLGYLSSPEPKKAEVSLQIYGELFENSELYEFLTDLLIQEGEPVDAVDDIVYDAMRDALNVLYEVICRQAGNDFEAGEAATSIALLTAVINSGFDADAIDAALLTLVTVGEREAERISEAINDPAGWSPDQLHSETSAIENLSLLTETLEGHIPNAALWLSQVAIKMRSVAIDLANEEDKYEQAERILLYIRTLPLSDSMEEKILADLISLRPLIEQSQKQLAWEKAGIKPIDKAPELMTINGFGVKLYGRTKFPLQPEWYLTTYYFVALYLPIFPLRRYLVSDTPGGGWRFHGSVPFTKANKVHLAVALLLPVLFLIFCSFSNNPTPPDSTGNKISSNVATSTQPSPASSGDSQNAEPPKKEEPAVAPESDSPKPTADNSNDATPSAASDNDALPSSSPGIDANAEEKKRLGDEYDKLKAETDKERPSIETRRTALDARSDELESERQTLDQTDQAAIDTFNEKVDLLNSDRQQFQTDVKEFNQKINRINEIVARLKELDK